MDWFGPACFSAWRVLLFIPHDQKQDVLVFGYSATTYGLVVFPLSFVVLCLDAKAKSMWS